MDGYFRALEHKNSMRKGAVHHGEGAVFPPEVTGGAFKVTLTGRGRAWVEQHQGLLGYTAEEALFRTKEGTLRISGANLRFLRYSSSDAIVNGRIDAISVLGGGT